MVERLSLVREVLASMERALKVCAAIVVSLGLAAAAEVTMGTAAEAHSSGYPGMGYGYNYGYGYGAYPGYPNNYYPNYYYPYEYYTPHAEHSYPYSFPMYQLFYHDRPSYLVCHTIIKPRSSVGKPAKSSTQVVLRSCYRAYDY